MAFFFWFFERQNPTCFILCFRGHKVRSIQPQEHENNRPRRRSATTDDLPDLNDKDVQDAATKIQAAFKGHKVRKQGQMASEVKKATVFKGHHIRKSRKPNTKPVDNNDDLPDLNDKDVQDAATKIQAAFKGHKTRKGQMASEVKKATVFKSSHHRHIVRKSKPVDDDLPDLKDKDVQDAATKIQAAFKGHKARKGQMASEVKKATVFKGHHHVRKAKPFDEDLPDLNDKEVQDAATKIQAAFKGHKTRKQGQMASEVKKATVFKSHHAVKKSQKSKKPIDDDLPDLKDKEVQEATEKIQAAFKGYKFRKGQQMASEVKKATVFKRPRKQKPVDNDDVLPDLTDKGVQDAATKIQAAFKGHQIRKKGGRQMASEVKKATAFKGRRTKQQIDNDLPDLEDKDVQNAATKIQAAFKGHKVRSSKKAANKDDDDDDLPDLKDAKVAEATLKIQTVFRGFHARKEVKARQEVKTRAKVTADSVAKAFGMSETTTTVRRKTPATPAPSVDLDNLPPPPPEPERKSSLVLEGMSIIRPDTFTLQKLKIYAENSHSFFSFSILCNLTFSLMNALGYVDINQGIYKGISKVV